MIIDDYDFLDFSFEDTQALYNQLRDLELKMKQLDFLRLRLLDLAAGRLCSASVLSPSMGGLYAVHASGVSCPIHGSCDDKPRLRSYVRQSKQQEIVDAMANWLLFQSLKREFVSLVGSIDSTRRRFGFLPLVVDFMFPY